MRCEEDPDLALHDDAVRIFLNTHGTDEENITPELKELLEFMEHTNGGMELHSERLERLRKSVRNIQANEELGERYMNAWEEMLDAKEEGREEGRKEGRREGRQDTMLQSVAALMETMGWSAEQAMDALKISEGDRETMAALL